MAASFWESTQRRFWIFSKEQLAELREKLEDDEHNLVQMFPLPEWRHLSIYFNQQMNRLGKRLSMRQQAIATAQLYIKRFYTKVEIRRTNPYLVIATALYLACKMEECPQHIRLVVTEARSLWPDLLSVDVSRLGECEFFLISEMNSQLIIHQPYRTLASLQADFSLSQDEVNLSWSVINDHYMTDLPLLYPPHIIALTAILLSLVLRVTPSAGNPGANMAAASAALAHVQAGRGLASGQTTPGGAPDKDKRQEDRVGKVQRFAAFLAESNVDIEAMVDCTQELISFYECHEQYNDKATRDQINRFVKARGLDKA
ncbi:cyclin-C [Pseudomassariella vexata]|uniref:RNA polymerase II holoenzyme cyclin-like subunit n=1 Tax=Pseudomassariella vexata TaxID=1141098 RepID=A0A1Y2DY93_9PEZI|nr:cyclin-C [Pseudomassariella vexata]ORY64223.1 cyclin-C [Pseudomassariella vexata]